MGDPIPVGDLPLLVDYEIPEDEEISWEVRRIFLNHLEGLSVMRAEHLRQWLMNATQEDSTDAINWQKVVAIVQEAFHEGTLA